MSLEERINADLKSAMIAKEKVRIDALRSIRSAILEFQKSGSGKELDEKEGIKILTNAAKKRKDAIKMYQDANRAELAEKEEIELGIIEEYLPKQLSDDELRDIVKAKIEQTGASEMKDMGKIMGPIMKEYAGQVDGNQVQNVVKELLG